MEWNSIARVKYIRTSCKQPGGRRDLVRHSENKRNPHAMVMSMAWISIKGVSKRTTVSVRETVGRNRVSQYLLFPPVLGGYLTGHMKLL